MPASNHAKQTGPLQTANEEYSKLHKSYKEIALRKVI
jgi:hypothetical protein